MNQELQYTGHLFNLEKAKVEEHAYVSNNVRRDHFDDLFKKLYLPVFYFARTFVEFEDAEDITANSFLKLWRSDLDYSILPKVKTWLNVCTRNACLDLIKTKRFENVRHTDFAYLKKENEDQEIENQIKEELLDRLDFEIEKLPPQCKRVFKMAYLDGQTSREIAGILNISENTVSNHRVRAYQLLRIALKSYTNLLIVLSFFFSYPT